MVSKVVSYGKGIVVDHGALDFKKASELKDDVVWVDLVSPSRDEINQLGVVYNFHPLALDDCLHAVQRPKLEDYGSYIFLVVKSFECERCVKSIQLSIFLGGNYIITVSEAEIPSMTELRKKILSGGYKAVDQKSDYLLYSILDHIVDNYFVVLDKIEDDIEVIENEVVKKPTPHTLHLIFKVKKELLYFRKPVWPTREVLHFLQAGSIKSVNPKLIPYFRDVYDHIIQVMDLIETYRELASSSLDTYLSSLSNSMNEVIKVLTVLASVFIVPTLIA
ncbi:MAG: magnesium/cobalt transporter CorA, partial [Candidatus Altiarchaeota archaeon]|nr:magnesium/cobalt transporter CorA [Candidatus Altiarchaeota archaeon]